MGATVGEGSPSVRRGQRILVLSPSYLPVIGGLERVVETLAREWARLGADVRIFRDGVEVDIEGAVLATPSSRRLMGAARWADAILGVNTPLKQLPFVLHAWNKVVLQHHSMYSFSGAGSSVDRCKDLVRAVAIYSRPNIAVSPVVAEVLPAREVKVIANPVTVPTTPLGTWNGRVVDFLFVGRFTHDKGLDLYLQALTRLPGEWTAVVAGAGPEGHYLQTAAVRRLRDDRKLTVLGPLPAAQVSAQMSQARWVVIPSRSETFGQVAVEALGHGCGLIVSGVGGLGRYVGQCALGFVPSSADSLTETMRTAMEAGISQEWSAKSGAIVAEHSPSRVAKSYLAALSRGTRGSRLLLGQWGSHEPPQSQSSDVEVQGVGMTDEVSPMAFHGLHDVVAGIAGGPNGGGRALDVGAGSGALANRLLECGWTVQAVDRDEHHYRGAAPFTRVDLNDAHLALDDQSFDLITLVEVIEHVENPASLLRWLSGLLSDSGRLIVTTPNVDSLAARLKFLVQGKIRAMDQHGDPTHITPIHWDILFEKLLPQASLNCESYVPYPKGFSSGRRTTRLLLNNVARFVANHPPLIGDAHVFVLRRVDEEPKSSVSELKMLTLRSAGDLATTEN